MNIALAAALLLLVVPPARAEQRPWPPLRDATVRATVTTTGPGQAPQLAQETVYVHHGDGDSRIEAEGGDHVVLKQLSTGRQFVFFPRDRRTTEIIPDDLMTRIDVSHRNDLAMPALRGARIEVAGQPCISWHSETADEVIDRCVTDSNITVRDRRSRPGGSGRDFDAVSLSYGALDPGLFAPPPDFLANPPAATVDAALQYERTLPTVPQVANP